ncbi:hypothetical protein HDR67_03590 [bacterium]|nr:hypothetical protein [bacterium]
MRKFLIAGLVVLCGIFIFMRTQETKEIRVRVIPNSNTTEDLKIKEKAKNITICYLKEAYDQEYSIYLSNLKSTTSSFQYILEKEINQKVEVQLGNHTLYNKTYNNSAVKNTNEMTLYVILGEGKGDNWWGTVYPEFLEVNSSEEVKYESLILSIFKKIRS